ncbi:hypothetical protein [Lederbergia citri]|uniref:Uncharacterized protein n=1 Tax=Lederbergia citri TaxID=2833580 RepID=A0A942TFY6_9BACI|nr:hypothetical protein [Lederbergia citri]MBS4195822.1 hypothetical protein [Lederbergia citri]
MNQLKQLLSTLKKRDELFHQERDELRNDFLLRGICETEVDGLLDDPSLFPTSWLPETLRWKSLSEAGNVLPVLLKEAALYLECDVPPLIEKEEAEKMIQSKK